MLILSKSGLDVVAPALQALSTTGAITAESYDLTVADASGFEVGNSVIVETGGEVGGGLRGSIGVGGIYADTDVASNPAQYYTTGTVPKALRAEIVGKSGNVLELDTPAVASTTNATVWFDNLPVWDALGFDNGAPFSNKQIIFPEGRFAFSQRLRFYFAENAVVHGAGTIVHTPKGSPPAYLVGSQCHGTTFKNLTFQGNFLLHGFGLDPTSGAPYGKTGIAIEAANGCVVHNITGINGPMNTVGLSLCSGTRVYRCRNFRTDPLAIYLQWHFQTADGDANHFYYCTHDSPYLDKAFETFRSSNDRFIGCGGRNVLFAMNTAGGYEYVDCWSTIEANSQYSDLSIHRLEPIVNVNSNIDPSDPVVALGGLIKNMRIVQQGYINGDKDSLKSILINVNNPDVHVVGDDYEKAYIEAPDWDSGSELYGAHIGSAGARTVINRVRVKGAANPTSNGGNINLDGAGSAVTNCVADEIKTGPTLSGNMTNAEYEA